MPKIITGDILYEGKAKTLRSLPNEPDILLQTFRDSATAFNGEKKEELEGKGETNTAISTLLFRYLRQAGIESHFICQVGPCDMLVRKVDIIPLEVVARKIVAGSLVKRIGMPEGTRLSNWLIEFYYKRDDLGDPLLRDDHILELGIASRPRLEELEKKTKTIARILSRLFKACDLELVDFKLEFGVTSGGDLILADEVSPDTCRIWEKETDRKLDKDLFRFGLGDPIEGYKIILERLQALGALSPGEVNKNGNKNPEK